MSWKQQAIELDKQGISWREIGRRLGVSKSTVSDMLRNHRKQRQTQSVGAKVLFLDVEVAPSITVAFSRFKAFASPDHVLQEPYMLTYVVKWMHEDVTYGNTLLDTEHVHLQDDGQLISALWEYLNDADIVVAQNAKFDRGWFNQRCIIHGLNPPSPYKLVDTLQMLKRNFSLPSNSLAAAAQYFNLTRKKSHSGIDMWIKCMNGDAEAFEEMLDYNDGDVVTLEELYKKIQPFSNDLPNMSLYYKDAKPRCVGCGSSDIAPTKYLAHTALSSFETMQCRCCGKYSRTRKNVRTKQEMSATMLNVI